MAEKKLMEKVVRKVLRSFPKVNMPDPFVPYPIAYPPTAKSRFEIFVHVAERGNGPLGHVDLCIDGFVYSYGNYDETNLKLGGWIAEGVLIKAPREEYMLFCKNHYQKALHIYTIAVTDEQMDKIHAYLAKILEPTTQWRPTGEAIYYNPTFDRFEEMYVYFMAQQMDTVFYKFNRSKFMTYNGWTRNCVSFADHVAKVLRERALRAKNMVFPAQYHKRLQKLLKKNSPLITNYEVY